MNSIYGFSSRTPDPFKKKVIQPSTLVTNGVTKNKVSSPYPIYGKSTSTNQSFFPDPIRKLTYGQNSSNNNQLITPSIPTNDKTTTTPNPTASYFNDIANVSKESGQFLKDKLASDEAYYDKLYGQKNEALGNQIPFLQKNFDQLKTDTEGSINDVNSQANQAGVNAETQWGTDQRALAQTRRESEGRTNAKYAMLNTTDSYGEGSYGRAQENVESDFNRQTATGLQGLGDKKFKIGQELSTFVRQAKSFIMSEQSKLNAKVQEIADNFNLNEGEKSQLKKQAYDEYQSGILGIKQNLANLKYEYAKTNTATGTNQNKALNMVNNILGGNIGGISGALRYGNIPIIGQKTGAATTQTDYDGLKALLSLAERGQLKGSGAVSDFEAKVLEKAAMAGLNQNLPTDEFKRRLIQLKSDLESGGAVDNRTSLQSPNSIQVGRFTVSQ